MPRPSAKPHPLTRADAKRIWLHAQRLTTPAPFGDGAAATRAAVEHLGYVQIDTINVIERCHHHILWSRIPVLPAQSTCVRPRASTRACSNTGPTPCPTCRPGICAFSSPTCGCHRREGHQWFNSVSTADLRKVLTLIRKGGALTIRDIDDDVLVEKQHPWASRKPSKRALQLAFYTGAVTISERTGMLKTYELMERHFGWDKVPKPASATETSAYLLDRALRAQGIVSLDSVCYHDAQSKPAIRQLIEARVRRGELVPVALDGAGKLEHWARPDAIATGGPALDMIHILSPFDPLIIQRKRTHLFFDYDHRFEAYVPKAKRRFGYFALPVLVDGDIVAAIDLKTDRKKQELLMQKWTWIGRGPRKTLKRRIEEELHRFERFQLGD